MSNTQRFLQEAMTAKEIAEAQNEHYQLDDSIRRNTGRLTAEQKRKVLDLIRSMSPNKEG